MQFVLMFGVMLILFIPCLFVLLRIAVRSRESEDHPGTWNLKSQVSCALDHSFLPNNVHI
jgi:predicted secreted protein